MTKKKFLTLLLCLVLIVSVTLPTPLALSSDSDGASDEVSLTPEEPGAEGEEGEEPEPYDGPIDQELPENPELPELPEDPENPENPDEPVCTCEPQPEEGEPHQLDCPLYEEPETQDSKHIPTCFDGSEDPFCPCPCHLFDRIMACMTQDELEELIAQTPVEYFELLSAEQMQAIESHISSLETVPLPALVLEDNLDEGTVPSEIVHPTVNFTYVAPFGEPVTGGR